jgi:hypothetical protein
MDHRLLSQEVTVCGVAGLGSSSPHHGGLGQAYVSQSFIMASVEGSFKALWNRRNIHLVSNLDICILALCL